MIKIKTLSKFFSEDQIETILKKRDRGIAICKIDKIYYPYASMNYSVKLKNILSKLNKRFLCVIDLVNGREAIGDASPALMDLEVEDVMVIPAEIPNEKLDEMAHSYISKMVLSKMKILHTPVITLDKIEYLHKLFYIIQCKNDKGQDYFLMVDSMDGNLTILNY